MAYSDNRKDLEKIFTRAANHFQSLVPDLDTGQLLGFYGLYKQATIGKCDTTRPSWYRTEAKHKWDAWNNLNDMSKETAMENYIRGVGKLDPAWDNSLGVRRFWVAVSTMQSTDVELQDSEKTLLDWVKDGNEEKVREALVKESSAINESDENGMMPIHWAADRGHVAVLKCLIEAGANLDAQDSTGQTALHYAVSCSHTEAIDHLLSYAPISLVDNDGMTPKDLANQ